MEYLSDTVGFIPLLCFSFVLSSSARRLCLHPAVLQFPAFRFTAWHINWELQLTVQCTVYSVQCTVYSVQCTVYSVQYTVYSVQCTVYSVKCSVQCTVYSVQCTVYSVQCTVYSVLCIVAVTPLVRRRSEWERAPDSLDRAPKPAH